MVGGEGADELRPAHARQVEVDQRDVRGPPGFNQRQGFFGPLPRVLEPLPHHVHLGVIDEAESPQIYVAHPLGEGAALPEVAVGRAQPSAVRTHHPQVVVGERAAVLVAAVPIRVERALVPRDRFVQLTLNVREDAQILLHAGAQLPTRSAELEGLEKRSASVVRRTGRQMQAAQGIQRFRREQVVARLPGHLVAPLAQVARGRGLGAVALHHRESPQRFSQDRGLAAALSRRDRGLVAHDRFGKTRRPLPLARLMQEVGGPPPLGRPGTIDGHGQIGLTRRWHIQRSGTAPQ